MGIALIEYRVDGEWETDASYPAQNLTEARAAFQADCDRTCSEEFGAEIMAAFDLAQGKPFEILDGIDGRASSFRYSFIETAESPVAAEAWDDDVRSIPLGMD